MYNVRSKERYWWTRRHTSKGWRGPSPQERVGGLAKGLNPWLVPPTKAGRTSADLGRHEGQNIANELNAFLRFESDNFFSGKTNGSVKCLRGLLNRLF